MKLLANLLAKLPDAPLLDVCIGLNWTAVVVDIDGETRCGLASTLSGRHLPDRRGPDVPQAGKLLNCSGRELAQWCLLQESPTQASIGMAALNALLPRLPLSWQEANAEHVIVQHGVGKRVVLVGHFPFIERLQASVGELVVLEQNPRPGDLPAEAAAQVLPGAQVAAITGMTLANHTLEPLLSLCSPETFVVVLGPSTPLHPILFDYGVDVISGSIVTNVEPVLRVVAQGGNFRQVHNAGVKLVNMQKPGCRWQQT